MPYGGVADGGGGNGEGKSEERYGLREHANNAARRTIERRRGKMCGTRGSAKERGEQRGMTLMFSSVLTAVFVKKLAL